MPEQNSQMEARGIVRYSNAQQKQITKECIEGALIQLLEHKEMEKITISEIVKRAGVSRTAFYAHYETKEDVLRSVLRETIDHIDGLTSGTPDSKEFWLTLFSETKSIAGPFALLLKAGMGNQILEEITERILSDVPDDPAARYSEILWVGAIYNVLTNWISRGTVESPQEMAEYCCRSVHFH